MHYKQNNKESRSYVQGLRSFGNTLPRGIKGILKKNGYNYSEIISKWNLLVGKEISTCSFPKSIKMKKGDKNGTLILAVKRGDEINVEYSKNEIINKINSYFGYQLISDIRLQTFNLKEQFIKNKNIKKIFLKEEELKSKINKIKNNNIKSSLLELLKEIKND
tara:strand:- start:1197 stop:1685 length:489 start_codon:yes stop_codon:yes gene_type:complete